MELELPHDVCRYIDAQLTAGYYRTPAELIGDLVRRQKEQDDGERRLWNQQKRALAALLGQMATVPAPTREDGLTNRDHDHILYGGKP